MKFTKNESRNCVICDTRLRDIIFDCKHQVCCKYCYLKIKNKTDKCPICRKIINNVSENKIIDDFQRKHNCFESYCQNLED